MFRWYEDEPFKNSDHFQLTGFVLIDNETFNDSVVLEEDDTQWLVSRVGVKLHLKRQWYHFLLDVYLPSALFVVMSWISFWLSVSAANAVED